MELIIPNLTKLDQLELQSLLGAEEVNFETVRGEDDIHGELATAAAIVIVSVSALKVIATYLAKKTAHKTYTYKVRTRTPEGIEHEVELKYDSGSSSPPDAQILHQLSKATNIDVKGIGDAFANLT